MPSIRQQNITWTIAVWKYSSVVVNFDALAQASDFQIERRQFVFHCWMQDLNQGVWNRISNRLNARWKPDWAIEDQAKKTFNSTARPYDQRAFSPLVPSAIWISQLALTIYMFVVVNFDALAQASDLQIEMRQVVSLCWMQDLNTSLTIDSMYRYFLLSLPWKIWLVNVDHIVLKSQLSPSDISFHYQFSLANSMKLLHLELSRVSYDLPSV